VIAVPALIRHRGWEPWNGSAAQPFSLVTRPARYNQEEGDMKPLTTVLAAAFIAGSATVAMAQASGGAGGDANPDRINKGADQNPTGPGANPAAGTKEAVTPGQAKTGTSGGAMTTAPVSGTTQSKDSSTPSQAPTGTTK
jgi:hypothetical protein